MKVLVIEDDQEVSSYIKKSLCDLGHQVDIAEDGKDGLFLATTEDYDVMVVDRMLPGLDGLTLLSSVRAAKNDTPAIFLSAMGSVDDRVKGLRSGGDDYLIKPFAFSELLARMELIVQRKTHVDTKVTELQAFDLKMDLLARKVCRGGEEIELQSQEFRLLEFMLRHKGQLVTRTMLLENVWDYHFDPQTNVIDVHISRIRQKIDKGHPVPIIRTIRGSGYLIPDKD